MSIFFISKAHGISHIGLYALILLVVLISTTAFGLQPQTSESHGLEMQRPSAVFSNTALIAIADRLIGDTPPGIGSPYPSTIVVSGEDNSIVQLQVTLTRLNHMFPDDLDVLLVGPGGQSFILQSDAGGNTSAANKTYTFDDAAPTQLADDGGISTGTFKPTNYQGNDGTTDTFPVPAPTGPYGNPGPQSAGALTLNGVFGGTNPNGTWSLYVTDDENNDAGNINGGWSISIVSVPNDSRAGIGDFDGDGKTDLAVVRNSSGNLNWYINGSTQGFVANAWGTSGDIPVPRDYDGDGKADIAVYRPSEGNWYIFQSSNSTFNAFHFGAPGDDPVIVDDYDGDGRADAAVVRNSGGMKIWYVLRSTDGFFGQQWGIDTDIAVPGDFDGDGKADLAVRRDDTPSADLTIYYFLGSTSGFNFVAWGNNSDTIVSGDYDGDATTDIAVVRNAGADLTWHVRLSNGGSIDNVAWGFSTDRPTQGDYDGDKKTDISVWRPTVGDFYTIRSSGGVVFSQWGLNGDCLPLNCNSACP